MSDVTQSIRDAADSLDRMEAVPASVFSDGATFERFIRSKSFSMPVDLRGLTRAQYAALDEDDQQEYDELRRYVHFNPGTVGLPALQDVVENVRDLVAANAMRQHQMRTGLVIRGDPGVGKSYCLHHVAKDIAQREYKREFGRDWRSKRLAKERAVDGIGPVFAESVPVVGITLEGNATPKRITSNLLRCYTSLFDEVGLPRLVNSERLKGLDESQLAGILANYVQACGTKLVIIDEIHFLTAKVTTGTQSINHVKHLVNTVPATFVVAGVHADAFLGDGLKGDARLGSQTAGRFQVERFEPFYGLQSSEEGDPDFAEWLALLGALESNLVLFEHKPGTLLAPEFAEYLFKRTGGYIQSVVSLIGQAANRVLGTDREVLTIREMESIRLDERAEQIAVRHMVGPTYRRKLQSQKRALKGGGTGRRKGRKLNPTSNAVKALKKKKVFDDEDDE